MRELKIAYGNSCNARSWSNQTTTWESLCERLQTTIRTAETAEQYKKMNKTDKAAAKDKGGFVGGHLTNGRRLVQNVSCRSFLTLDADLAEPGFLERFEKECQHAAVVYTTHGHTPEAPRLRIVIPFAEDITPDCYAAVARYYTALWGIDQFDECSYRVNQLMYWPTTPGNGEFICRIIDGPMFDPMAFLEQYPDWRDCSKLPISSREDAVRIRDGRKQEDPHTKPGIVGAFCRAYTIQDAIDTFLSDVYSPSVKEDRYDFIAGEGTAGVVIYDDTFAYSHHATDPASGVLCNAFDLVRIHRFDKEDKKASFNAMAEFAAADERVQELSLKERQERAGEDFAEPIEDDDSWKKKLVRQKRSTQLENSLYNIKLIMQNDPYLKNIVFNQLADGLEIKGEVPWSHPARFWRDADDAQLICYVDDNYGSFSARNYDIAVTKVADDRSYHPIRKMFESLPEWDGVDRAESILIDYLGATDNAYVRAVTRKALCAAYMRVYHPGIKYDYILVLNGSQGIGKSTLIAKLGMDWFCDSLTLSDMNDKTAAEKLQGYWIHEIGEMAGMRKADLEKVKAFVSRQDDKYRASFGRRVTPHPRQCIFFGTTNSDNGYLRDITGNRRFWNVKVTGEGKFKPWDLKEEDIEQIWAEVVVIAKKGEKLFLPADLEEFAKTEQREAMEHDEREGLVREYLDTLLPANWADMDSYERRDYFRNGDDPTRPVGTVRREIVSNIEIWCECFGKNKEDFRPTDSYMISSIMVRISEWKKDEKRVRLPIYGQQRVYTRTS